MSPLLLEQSLWTPVSQGLAVGVVPVEIPWTPVLGGEGGTSGQTYANRAARAAKVGSTVHVWGQLTLSAKGTITGAVQIQGLPYPIVNISDLYAVGTVPFFGALATNWIVIGLHGDPTTSALKLRGVQAAAAGVTGLTTADIANATSVMFEAVYMTTV